MGSPEHIYLSIFLFELVHGFMIFEILLHFILESHLDQKLIRLPAECNNCVFIIIDLIIDIYHVQLYDSSSKRNQFN